MPIYTWGTFTANLAGENPTFIISKPIQFTFYPVGQILWILLILGVLHWFYHYIDQPHSYTNNWALVPALIGLSVFFISINLEYVMPFLPMIVQTAILLVWYRQKNKTQISAFISALLTATILIIFLLSQLNVAYPSPVVYLIFGFGYGIFIVLPMIILRVAVRGGITPKRLSIGLLFAVGIPYFLIAVLLTIFRGSRGYAYLFVLLFISASALPFYALLRWNPWVRKVVTCPTIEKGEGRIIK